MRGTKLHSNDEEGPCVLAGTRKELRDFVLAGVRRWQLPVAGLASMIYGRLMCRSAGGRSGVYRLKVCKKQPARSSQAMS